MYCTVYHHHQIYDCHLTSPGVLYNASSSSYRRLLSDVLHSVTSPLSQVIWCFALFTTNPHFISGCTMMYCKAHRLYNYIWYFAQCIMSIKTNAVIRSPWPIDGTKRRVIKGLPWKEKKVADYIRKMVSMISSRFASFTTELQFQCNMQDEKLNW